jgi:hypothetical protein
MRSYTKLVVLLPHLKAIKRPVYIKALDAVVIPTNVGCGECGKGRKHIVVFGYSDIWTACDYCGFHEWEWAEGDDPSYLEHLNKEYQVERLYGTKLQRLAITLREGIR